jgi:hypothetical protein
MDVLGFNVSRRSAWNTPILLTKALEGAASQGAQTKVVSDLFGPEMKVKRREEMFPLDCEKAFRMGARLAGADRQ